jgi:hypothetical protein
VQGEPSKITVSTRQHIEKRNAIINNVGIMISINSHECTKEHGFEGQIWINSSLSSIIYLKAD